MTARGSTFCSIPAGALMAELNQMGEGIATLGTEQHQAVPRPEPGTVSEVIRGNERVIIWMLPGHPDSRPCIHVYTSLAVGQDEVRDCGDDAIRIVVGVSTFSFIPAGESRRIFRTAPRKGTERERVDAFLARLRRALQDACVQALSIPVCTDCGRLMRRREGRHGAFLGCSGWPDACVATRAIPGENVGA